MLAKLKLLIAILGTLIGTQHTHAQQGAINVQEETGIRYLLDSRKSANFKENRTLRAWSVQIMTSRDKYEVLQKLQEVRSLFRDDLNVKVDWTYEQPYYRLNAGAFYTKLEAAALLYKVIQRYPSAYIFKNNQVKPTDF
jgi:hypothetical protein